MNSGYKDPSTLRFAGAPYAKDRYDHFIGGEDLWEGNVFDKYFKIYRENGDEGLEKKLITANIPRIISIAGKYSRNLDHLEFSDLISEGFLGLKRALKDYDPDRTPVDGHDKPTFITYAMPWINHYIRRAILDKEKGIRVPSNMRNRINWMIREKEDYTCKHGRKPTDKELADYIGETEKRVREILTFDYDLASIDFLNDEGEDKPEFYAKDSDSESPFDRIDAKAAVGTLLRGSNLTRREMKIIEKRFGFDGEGGKTLEEIGLEFGFTKERIRQIQEKAMEKLRNSEVLRKMYPEMQYSPETGI